MTNIYSSGKYLSHNPTWGVEHSAWKAGQILGMLDANGLRPACIADVGCGAGRVLIELAARLGDDVKLHGYEMSPQAFDLCQAQPGGRVNFHNQDVFATTHPPFDLAMAIDVFEHVPDYLGFLDRFRGLADLKLFHIPLDLSVSTVLRAQPIAHARQSVGHLHYFTRETAIASLEHCGYRIIDQAFTRVALDVPSPRWQRTLLKLPRQVLFAIHEGWAARLLGGFSLLVLAR